MFGDRSTGEAIRSQNGKGEGIRGPVRGGAGRGPIAVGRPGPPPLGTVKSPEDTGPSAALNRGPLRRPGALPYKGRTFEHSTLGGSARDGCGRPRPEGEQLCTEGELRPPRLPRPTHGPFVQIFPGGSIPDTTRLAHEEICLQNLVGLCGATSVRAGDCMSRSRS